MATPESKVKKKVKEILNEYKPYMFMPSMNGYGSSGVPDIVACIQGRFYGIECKANGNKPTKLQLKNLYDIVKAGGVGIVVDEKSVGVFKIMMDNYVSGMGQQTVLDLTLGNETDESKN
jgi:hypothetical protein